MNALKVEIIDSGTYQIITWCMPALYRYVPLHCYVPYNVSVILAVSVIYVVSVIPVIHHTPACCIHCVWSPLMAMYSQLWCGLQAIDTFFTFYHMPSTHQMDIDTLSTHDIVQYHFDKTFSTQSVEDNPQFTCVYWMSKCNVCSTLLTAVLLFNNFAYNTVWSRYFLLIITKISSPPRMFLSLDLLWEYRIQHGAYWPLYVKSSYSTWTFCRGVSGFATDCPCSICCHGLITCLLHVGPPFGNQILNNSWAVGLT